MSRRAAVVFGAAVMAGCQQAGAPSTTELSVFAAASLGTALERAADAYEAVSPRTRVVIATDSSAALRTQIEHGAPADLFLSADIDNAQALVDAGLSDGPAVRFAASALTIIVPAANPGGVASAVDLARPGVRVLAAGDEVPITRYASQLLANLATLPGYPPDLAARYEDNVVSREDSVSAVVAKVALGEADAAIVYVTDALATEGVASVGVPDEANVSATYAAVVIAGSPRADGARAFLDWVARGAGRRHLVEGGFRPPPDG